MLQLLTLTILSDAFDAYTTATGAVEDQTTGLLRLTTAQFANLESLFFTINGVCLSGFVKL